MSVFVMSGLVAAPGLAFAQVLPRLRRRKNAAERRSPGRRAQGRGAQRLLEAFKSITAHRGNQLGRLGQSLVVALVASGSPHAAAPAYIAAALAGSGLQLEKQQERQPEQQPVQQQPLQQQPVQQSASGGAAALLTSRSQLQRWQQAWSACRQVSRMSSSVNSVRRCNTWHSGHRPCSSAPVVFHLQQHWSLLFLGVVLVVQVVSSYQGVICKGLFRALLFWVAVLGLLLVLWWLAVAVVVLLLALAMVPVVPVAATGLAAGLPFLVAILASIVLLLLMPWYMAVVVFVLMPLRLCRATQRA